MYSVMNTSYKEIMKSLLLLSAKYADIAFAKCAKNKGYKVFSVGSKPEQPAHRVADKYINVSYMDYDAIIEIVKEYHINALCQGVTDACAIVASYVGEQLDLRGHDKYETSLIIHQKDKFKRMAKEIGIKTPDAKWFDSVDEAYEYETKIEYPIIVKPVDLGGGQGITVVSEKKDYKKAVDYAFDKSIVKRIVIEKYIHGTLHSMSTFIVQGRVVGYGTANDYSFNNHYLTNTGTFPADMHELTDNKLIQQCEAIARKLALVDGLLHFQYIIDQSGEPWIIEMMRRSPGNNFLKALSRSTGIDWVGWIIQAEAGNSCRDFPSIEFSPDIQGYHSIMSSRNGVFDGLYIDKAFEKYICESEYYYQKGQHIVNDYKTDKFGNIQFCIPRDSADIAFIPIINNLAYARVVDGE